MDDEPPVRVVDGAGDGDDEPDAVIDAEASGVGPGGDGSAIDELGDEVGDAVIGLAAVEEAGDAGVVERGEEVALASEPRADVGAGEGQRRADDFDGDGLLEGAVGPPRAIDPPHPALADLAFETVGPDLRALARASGARGGRLVLRQRRQYGLRVVEDGVVREGGVEQRAEPLAQRVWQSREVRTSGVAIEVKRGVEGVVDVRPRRVRSHLGTADRPGKGAGEP